jgi:glycosyltransferase involved in cell wall biosynthesis
MELLSDFLGEGSISIVLPAFNEEGNIEQAIHECLEVLSPLEKPYEVLVVDDGSADRTKELAEKIESEHPQVTVVSNTRNLGLGATLRRGFALAGGQFVFYTDSDLPIDMKEMVRSLPAMQRYDLLSGYRLNRDDGPRRYLYSWAYNKLVRLVLGISVRDVNFSFKLMKRELLQMVDLRSSGSFIDAELLAEAKKHGFAIGEIGVRYRPRMWGVSTLASPAVIVDIMRELLAYRFGCFGRRR